MAEPEKKEKFKGCRQCMKEWDICMCPSWPLHLIVFSRKQVFWLLQNYFEMEMVAGYDQERVDGTRNTSAGFESFSCVLAEIEARLACCGDAGEALEDEAPHVQTIDYLSRPARRALNYCSGWRRRKLSYSAWQKQAKYRESELVK